MAVGTGSVRAPRIGVDVGGTKALGVLIGDDGEIGHTVQRPTRRDPDGLVALVGEVVSELEDVAGVATMPGTVGVGIPGLIDRDGRLHATPHLADPDGRPLELRRLLEARLGRPVRVDNDATFATFAEWRTGGGRGLSSMIMITLGTGIGGGIVLGGELQRGEHGFAGEFGHMMVDPDGPPCVCGRRGCWELYASGQGLRSFAREAAAEGRLAAVLAAAEGDIEAVTGEAVEDAARGGDADARAVFDVFADWIAIGLSNLINAFDPAAFVLGGGLAGTADVLEVPIRRHLAEHLYASALRPQPDVRFAELGPAAGAIGAALLGGG